MSEPTQEHWGLQTEEGNLRIATLNVNGLTYEKLQHLLNYLSQTSTHVLALQDTRLKPHEKHAYHNYIRRAMGKDTYITTAPISPPTTVNQIFNGGQMIIICVPWSKLVQNSHHDPSPLGLLHTVTLASTQTKLHIPSTYWPYHHKDPLSHPNSLESNLQTDLHRRHIRTPPLEWLQDTITKTQRDLLQAPGTHILLGDFNHTWQTRKTPAQATLEDWATPLGWTNAPIIFLRSYAPDACHPPTRFAGDRATGDLDHILLSSHGQLPPVTGYHICPLNPCTHLTTQHPEKLTCRSTT